jgi:hypothetical protein
MSSVERSGGPNGIQVAHFLERLCHLTPEQWAALDASVPPMRRQPLARLRHAAAFIQAVMEAPMSGRRPEDVDAIMSAVDDAVESGQVPDEGRDLAFHAGMAVLLQDVLPAAELERWYGPFEEVIPRASL